MPTQPWIRLVAGAVLILPVLALPAMVRPATLHPTTHLPHAADGADIPADTLPADLPNTSPFGLPELTDRNDNLAAALGRKLFFDPILSSDQTVACASCHDPEHGFADPRPKSLGVGGQSTTRHAPTLVNRAYGTSFMWDGRIPSLEEQVLEPIENELEMNLPLNEAIQRLRDDDEYTRMFAKVYERDADRATLAQALAAFVRRLRLGDSPVDRFRAGQFSTLTDAERAGLWLFESRGQCWRCHSGPNFTDEALHNTGVGVIDGAPQVGGFGVTGEETDRGAFKTPTLRGLASTAPYMHDGSLGTLEEVVDHYRKGGVRNPALDEHIAPIDMSDADASNLAALLLALSRGNSARSNSK